MREIEFRGKITREEKESREDCPEWVFGSLNVAHNEILVDCLELNLVSIEVIPETVGQYIGRKDKHGTKIFKDDIVKCITVCRGVTFTNTYWVDYDEVNARFFLNCGGIKSSPTFDDYDIEDLEVIGNIHDKQNYWKVKNAKRLSN